MYQLTKGCSLCLLGLAGMNNVFGNLRIYFEYTVQYMNLCTVFTGNQILDFMSTVNYLSLYVSQGSKKGKSGEGLLQWDSEREMVLQALIQLLQLDIRSLWSLSLVEEEFIRYFSALCGKKMSGLSLVIYLDCGFY